MSKLKTLTDGLIDELKDLYSAESQLLKALPKMEKKATNQSLKEAIRAHLGETEGQLERLNEIGTILQQKLTGKTCKAMQGLIEEGKEVMEEDSDNSALIDALLIGAAQRVEHYEMAAYGTACAMARELGEDEVVSLLEETLEEEKAADEKLTAISEEEILGEAQRFSDSDEDEDEDVSEKKKLPPRQNKKSGNVGKTLALVGGLLLLGNSLTLAESNRPMTQVKNEKEAAQYKADDTGKNIRDRNESRVTAQDQPQNENENDIDVLARVRRAVVANDNLSTYAKNVKIVVGNGEIVLRGPVTNATEKSWLAEAAGRAATGFKVVNELEIAPK